VVCPGSLAEQWQDELYRRFHLPFEILTTSDTEVGTDAVAGLAAAAPNSAESVDLTAPVAVGTYNYGARIHARRGEVQSPYCRVGHTGGCP